MMIPQLFLPYRDILPMLNTFTTWTLLKEWQLALVYRVTSDNKQSYIVKWDGENEAGLYEDLLKPLNVACSYYLAWHKQPHSNIIIMEDVGQYTLEQRPTVEHFIKAITLIAQYRKVASINMSLLPDHILKRYTQSTDDIINMITDSIVKLQTIQFSDVLTDLKTQLPKHLEKLYEKTSKTIVHQDYVAKNLVIDEFGNVTAIDWTNAYIGNHLGDVYSLIIDAERCLNLNKDILIEAYSQHYEGSKEQLLWEYSIGAICWNLKNLRWLVYGGTDIIPGSEAWIPGFIYHIDQHLQKLKQL